MCLEASGAYHLDLALALADAGVRLMTLNPKAVHNFATVLLRNSKTDAVMRRLSEFLCLPALPTSRNAEGNKNPSPAVKTIRGSGLISDFLSFLPPFFF
jgi:hypothetical protein